MLNYLSHASRSASEHMQLNRCRIFQIHFQFYTAIPSTENCHRLFESLSLNSAQNSEKSSHVKLITHPLTPLISLISLISLIWRIPDRSCDNFEKVSTAHNSRNATNCCTKCKYKSQIAECVKVDVGRWKSLFGRSTRHLQHFTATLSFIISNSPSQDHWTIPSPYPVLSLLESSKMVRQNPTQHQCCHPWNLSL